MTTMTDDKFVEFFAGLDKFIDWDPVLECYLARCDDYGIEASGRSQANAMSSLETKVRAEVDRLTSLPDPKTRFQGHLADLAEDPKDGGILIRLTDENPWGFEMSLWANAWPDRFKIPGMLSTAARFAFALIMNEQESDYSP